jgi:hypothetical protein
MSYIVGSSPVITDSQALNNIISVDNTTATTAAQWFISGNTISGGNTIRSARNAEIATNTNNYVQYFRAGFAQTGNVNFYFETRSNVSTVQWAFRILRYRNGVVDTVLSNVGNNTTYSGINTTQAVKPGDFFSFELRRNNTNSSVRVRNMRVQTSSDTHYIPFEQAVYGWYHQY